MTLNVDVPEKLTELINYLSEIRGVDEATVLEDMIQEGAEEFIVQLISEGNISTTKGAELLGKSVYDIHRIAREKGIELSATEEQFDQSRDTSKELLEE